MGDGGAFVDCCFSFASVKVGVSSGSGGPTFLGVALSTSSVLLLDIDLLAALSFCGVRFSSSLSWSLFFSRA